MIKTDVGTKVHIKTNTPVFVVRITTDTGNWFFVVWPDDPIPTLYSESEFKRLFM